MAGLLPTQSATPWFGVRSTPCTVVAHWTAILPRYRLLSQGESRRAATSVRLWIAQPAFALDTSRIAKQFPKASVLDIPSGFASAECEGRAGADQVLGYVLLGFDHSATRVAIGVQIGTGMCPYHLDRLGCMVQHRMQTNAIVMLRHPAPGPLSAPVRESTCSRSRVCAGPPYALVVPKVHARW